MHRGVSALGAGVLALALVLPASAAEPQGAVVVHATYSCSVGWSDETWPVVAPCDIQNVMSPTGIFTQVLRGQIPVDAMAAFIADGSPSSYTTSCLVNYGYLRTYHDGDDWGPLMVSTPSVRHFTRDGRMTEVCAPSIARNILP